MLDSAPELELYAHPLCVFPFVYFDRCIYAILRRTVSLRVQFLISYMKIWQLCNGKKSHTVQKSRSGKSDSVKNASIVKLPQSQG